MAPPEHHRILQEIVSDFEALGRLIERALLAFAQDDGGSVDLTALHGAKDAARRGAKIARSASSKAAIRGLGDS